MIDTITLRLNETQFKINDHTQFSPDCHDFFYPPYARMGSRGYLDAYQNPTRAELQKGNYKPQLTVRKRMQRNGFPIFLYIQFSAPKLLYGNNFDELTNKDLYAIVDELRQKLFEMSVIVKQETLLKAAVVKIHYSKNIVLPEFVIPHLVTSEIRKVDFDLRYDLAEKDYRNAGHSVRFHSNEFELIFYDKKKDLERAKISDKRAVEKDSAIQLGLFDSLHTKNPFEVLRMEVRLNTYQKIASELKMEKEDMTLINLFSIHKSSQVLSKYWNEIITSYKLLKCDISDKERFFARFMVHNPNARLTNALAAYACIETIKEMGTRKFRRLVETRYSRRAWYGLKDSMNKYELYGKIPKHFEAVTQALDEYTPLRLSDYQNTLYEVAEGTI